MHLGAKRPLIVCFIDFVLNQVHQCSFFSLYVLKGLYRCFHMRGSAMIKLNNEIDL
jgi:hypothetical protein